MCCVFSKTDKYFVVFLCDWFSTSSSECLVLLDMPKQTTKRGMHTHTNTQRITFGLKGRIKIASKNRRDGEALVRMMSAPPSSSPASSRAHRSIARLLLSGKDLQARSARSLPPSR